MSAVRIGANCAKFIVGTYDAAPPTVAIDVLVASAVNEHNLRSPRGETHAGSDLREVPTTGPEYVVIVKLAMVRDRKMREWTRKTTSIELEASKLPAEELGRIAVNDGLAELERG